MSFPSWPLGGLPDRRPTESDSPRPVDTGLRAPASVSRRVLARLPSPTRLAMVVIALTVVAQLGQAIGLSIPGIIRASLAFATVVLCPGILLGRLVFRRDDVDIVEYLAVA